MVMEIWKCHICSVVNPKYLPIASWVLIYQPRHRGSWPNTASFPHLTRRNAPGNGTTLTIPLALHSDSIACLLNRYCIALFAQIFIPLDQIWSHQDKSSETWIFCPRHYGRFLRFSAFVASPRATLGLPWLNLKNILLGSGMVFKRLEQMGIVHQWLLMEVTTVLGDLIFLVSKSMVIDVGKTPWLRSFVHAFVWNMLKLLNNVFPHSEWKYKWSH